MDIATATGTTLHTFDEHQAVFDDDGRPLNAEDADEISRLMWDDGLIAEAFKYSNVHASSIEPGTSLYDFLVEKVAQVRRDPIQYKIPH